MEGRQRAFQEINKFGKMRKVLPFINLGELDFILFVKDTPWYYKITKKRYKSCVGETKITFDSLRRTSWPI